MQRERSILDTFKKNSEYRLFSNMSKVSDPFGEETRIPSTSKFQKLKLKLKIDVHADVEMLI